MLADKKAFSGFAVDDVDAAKRFYEETLGLPVKVMDEQHGVASVELAGGRETFFYAKEDFQPATYTILNFQVEDVDAAVDELSSRGVSFERYDGFDQDDKAISRSPGPEIAWFKDPAGNILAVMSEPGGSQS
jgi:predicted enzyme related to lactoylglutathione lyase